MSAKEILFSQEARSRIGKGVDALADAVKVTLGPRGRNVIIEKSWGSPLVTKDGVTVAKEIELEDKFANMGAQMVKEVASKTADVAGDGTTTATVLAQAIYGEGNKMVVAGHHAMEIKRGIDAATEAAVGYIEGIRQEVTGDQVAHVGTISANGDTQIGQMLSEAIGKVGKDGVITVESGSSTETQLDVVEGMQFDRGYLSPYFVTDSDRMEAVLENPLILVCERKISQVKPLVQLLEAVAKSGRPLLVVAEDVDGEALPTFVLNKVRETFRSCCVKAPGFGDRRKETLKDIAVLTGGQAITEDLGRTLESISIKDLGGAKRVVVSKDATTIIGGSGRPEEIEARVAQIRSQVEGCTSDYDREKLQERLAKLTGGVAVIRVGAATETEMKEKKARVEDALYATRAAVAEGIVPGGGIALLRAQAALDGLQLPAEQMYGVAIVRRALEAPIRWIAQNGGVEGSIVVNKVREGQEQHGAAYGYNAATDTYEDLVQSGVLDPTKVVRTALQNAASVAGLLLTTECAIADLPKKHESASMSAPHDHMM